MKAFNKNMQNGYDKFRKNINNGHVFRKAHNTLSQINNFALPVLTVASVAQPQLSPLFGSVGIALKAGNQITSRLKNKKI
jgi:hypothetical protein